VSSSPRLLIVSYVFPPAGGIPVQRALSFAKYLPRLGVPVHVLAAANPSSPVRDPALLAHVPPDVAVTRCLTLEPPFGLSKKLWSLIGRLRGAKSPAAAPAGGAGLGGFLQKLLTPDPQVLWTPLAIRRASSLIRRRRLDTVLVTAPPFSVFLIGNALKRRFPHLRLISDFRDEWLRFYLTDFDFLADPQRRRRAELLERETVERSDFVLAVTRRSLAEIRRRYPEQPDRKFRWLPNGYDPEVLAGVPERAQAGPRMVVTHLGTAYRTSSPRYYLQALDALPEPDRSQIETRFIGRIAETETSLLAQPRSHVRLYGFLPQQEALRLARETDYLLLTMTNDFSLPGKLFEYLALGKTILALSPPGGEVDEILRETGTGLCADPARPEAVMEMLRSALNLWRQGRTAMPVNWAAIREYERPRVAERLAALIREGPGESPVSPGGEGTQ
jgi:hypothetical protein